MTAQNSQQERELDEQLYLVISNEITIKVLIYLVERGGSPKEIAASLGLKVPTVSHHVKKLEAMRLVELIEERERRGAIQHIYRAVIRPIVSTEEWEKLDIEERQRFSIWIVQLILVDLARSFAASTFDARCTNHLSRTPMVVDEKGLDEVAAIQNRALGEIIQVEANSAERMARSGESGMDLIAAMMCFELPEPSEGLKAVDNSEGKLLPEESEKLKGKSLT
jgi:DNA-binding transcriptional ArsR family regulator